MHCFLFSHYKPIYLPQRLSRYYIYVISGQKQRLHQVDVIRIQQHMPWKDTHITFVTNVRRPIMVVKQDAMLSQAGNLSIPQNWFAEGAATWQGLRCVRSTGQTSQSINVDIVARWQSSFALEPPTSVTPATTTFNESPPFRRASCLHVLQVFEFQICL